MAISRTTAAIRSAGRRSADAGQQDHAVQKAQQTPRRLIGNRAVRDGHRHRVDGEESHELRIDRAGVRAFHRRHEADQGQQDDPAFGPDGAAIVF
jgi:hypothetical protein